MAGQTNLQKDVLVLNMEHQLLEIAQNMFDKEIAELTDQELYYVVLVLTKRLMKVSDENEGEKKVFYISAEFLIGKLLSNNLINLGVYDKMVEILNKYGKKLSVIEEVEPEPSLGNGGLGRLAACFMDSIATLGLPGEGIGLNYHFGLFKQVFRDKLQCAEKNEWMEKESWLTRTDISFDVFFGRKKVVSRLYDIDVPGYDKIDLHPAARFIGTMNYGYAGTKELNEALVSRFLVIDMPAQTEETLGFIFHQMFPNARESAVEQFVGLFLDLQLKALNSEISTKALDLRGLLAAMKIVDVGLSPAKAVRMGVVNKTFDVFEKEIVEDVVSTRIPSEWTREDVYE